MSSNNSSGHSLRKQLAPVRDPSPPMTTRLVIDLKSIRFTNILWAAFFWFSLIFFCQKITNTNCKQIKGLISLTFYEVLIARRSLKSKKTLINDLTVFLCFWDFLVKKLCINMFVKLIPGGKTLLCKKLPRRCWWNDTCRLDSWRPSDGPPFPWIPYIWLNLKIFEI